jgi:hypothetical protein
VKPIDMLLYCPNCGMQHIDAPEPPRMEQVPSRFAQMRSFQLAPTWDNPPHKSHLCHGCRCVWRPADVATNGVAELKTSGKGDTWPAVHNGEVRAMPALGLQPSDPVRGNRELRDLLREAGEVIKPMADWFRNQPLGAPPAGTAQLQANIRRVLAAAGVQASEPLRHSTKENGDCPHWCKACAAEAATRGVDTSRGGQQ